jgi:hypothetical protein
LRSRPKSALSQRGARERPAREAFGLQVEATGRGLAQVLPAVGDARSGEARMRSRRKPWGFRPKDFIAPQMRLQAR